MTNPIIETKNLAKYFGEKLNHIGLDSTSLSISEGEIFCLVGESGSGKSTLAKCLIGVHSPTKGEIFYKGKPKMCFDQRIQYIFQDPFSSLNPRMSILEILEEPLILAENSTRRARYQQILEILPLVGLHKNILNRYPHEFSGGQRQRIAITRAILMQPELLICDEPTSSLDVSIQAQIIQLLLRLKEKRNLTYLFISHDLRLVSNIADRVAVMKEGKVIECQKRDDLFKTPIHPYTKQLLEYTTLSL